MLIHKVAISWQDMDSLEEINRLTGLCDFETDNWCDLYTFEDYPELEKYVEQETLLALQQKAIDFIAFRLDR